MAKYKVNVNTTRTANNKVGRSKKFHTIAVDFDGTPSAGLVVVEAKSPGSTVYTELGQFDVATSIDDIVTIKAIDDFKFTTSGFDAGEVSKITLTQTSTSTGKR